MVHLNQPIILENLINKKMDLNLQNKDLVTYICKEGVFAIQSADKDSRAVFFKIYKSHSDRLKSYCVDELLHSYTQADFKRIHEMEVRTLTLFKKVLSES